MAQVQCHLEWLEEASCPSVWVLPGEKPVPRVADGYQPALCIPEAVFPKAKGSKFRERLGEPEWWEGPLDLQGDCLSL